MSRGRPPYARTMGVRDREHVRPRRLLRPGRPRSGRLVTVGWNVAVRADFDGAGIRHVATLLEGIPGAVPWRMMTEDFVESKPSVPATGPGRQRPGIRTLRWP